MKEPTIFLIEEDDETRPILRNLLKKNGYKVSLAFDEEDALDRVGKEGFEADLVLMDFPSKSVEEILDIGKNICRKGNLKVPIVVIAAKYGEDLEGTDVQVRENEYITYLEDGEQLLDLLDRRIPTETTRFPNYI